MTKEWDNDKEGGQWQNRGTMTEEWDNERDGDNDRGVGQRQRGGQ